MRICWALLSLLGLLGCAHSEPVEISVVNQSDRPLVATLDAGILSRQVVLWPHIPQSFVVPREYLPSKVRLLVGEQR